MVSLAGHFNAPLPRFVVSPFRVFLFHRFASRVPRPLPLLYPTTLCLLIHLATSAIRLLPRHRVLSPHESPISLASGHLLLKASHSRKYRAFLAEFRASASSRDGRGVFSREIRAGETFDTADLWRRNYVRCEFYLKYIT